MDINLQKIGIFHVILNPGGGAWSVIKELVSIQSENHPTAIGISNRKSLSNKPIQEAVNLCPIVFSFEPPIEFPNASAIFLPPIKKWHKELSIRFPDYLWITHFHNGGGIGLAFWPRFFPFINYKEPSVNTYHGIPPEDVIKELQKPFGYIQTNIQGFLSRRMTEQKVKLVTLSRTSRDEISSTYKIPNEKISIIPNGVACRISDEGNLNFQDKNTFIVGFVGALIRKKQWDIAVKSVLQLKEKYNIKLVIAGSGPDSEKITRLSQQYPNSIVYLGQIENASQKVIPKLNVLVLPSLHEGQAMVMLEALSNGIPVIVSNVGANKETITNGFNGYILETNTAEEVSEKLELLLTNPDIYSSIKNNAKNSWSSSFSSRLMAQRYQIIYQEVLKLYCWKE